MVGLGQQLRKYLIVSEATSFFNNDIIHFTMDVLVKYTVILTIIQDYQSNILASIETVDLGLYHISYQ